MSIQETKPRNKIYRSIGAREERIQIEVVKIGVPLNALSIWRKIKIKSLKPFRKGVL